MTQFSLFGAAAADPVPEDLDGILLAGGQWVRLGDTARLSVVVADHWRVAALATEFAQRGVADPDAVVRAEGGYGVRTAFTSVLVPHAGRWTRGANQCPPTGFLLTPGGLRLWTIAAGRRDESGFLLATAEPDDPVHVAGGAQLSRLGVPGVSISFRGGPGWRLTSAKRLRRLHELVGAAPDGAGTDWPTVH